MLTENGDKHEFLKICGANTSVYVNRIYMMKTSVNANDFGWHVERENIY